MPPMHIDRDLEPSRPALDRDAERDRDVDRHRREIYAQQPRRPFSDRVDGAVRDVGTFRAVALADLIKDPKGGSQECEVFEL